MSGTLASQCNWQEEGGGEAAAARCLDFLTEVGIPVRLRAAEELDQLIDGLAIRDGALVVDPDVTIWPGDLLHEAGHIAVMPADIRPNLGEIEANRDEELMAIAWSYAAAKVCDIGLRQLFHPAGYRGRSEFAASTYAIGGFAGSDGLAAHGMTVIDLPTALAQGVGTYPNMLRWLR
ncbi:hypothetical protein [Aurantiacibacter zhengii]|uniref:Uncharacterized protein n=1 Tax=Aurantiacibacter zhengii TaxID=2307003 RepID=A0A418NQT5_9SPHN|nr:hypothetical protein [Aurantiacibacter zhengii]RIV85164.1 hypothetical protein D2V07_12860 [Aurantiacibacter zhengii]